MRKPFLTIVTTLALAGCAGPQPRPGAPLPPVEDRQVTPPGAAAPSGGEAYPPPARSVAGGSGAVLALLEQARGAEAGGDLDRAANLVERALRIEPENPWLWYRLAHVRLAQGKPQAALELARKALSLAVDDEMLRERIRRLIRQAGGRSG